MNSFLRVTAALAVACGVAGRAAAQQMPREPDVDRLRIRLGPLYLNPTLALTNIGVDNNVFNESEADRPDRDFTFTATPASDWWLRLGRTWAAGTIREDLVWYKVYEGQRSINSGYSAAWLVPRNRLTFSVGGNWLSTKDRPGFEIDARARRSERAGQAIVELRALSKTFVGVRGERRTVEFDDSELFLGRNLASELNRTLTVTAVTLRNQLTPLTSVSFSISGEQDRFEQSSVRDSDSTRYDAAVSFDPFALIKGSAQFGFRDFRPLSGDVPGYSGSTAQVNLSYVAVGSTQVTLSSFRDVQYSFDVSQPYFLLTGVNVSVSQQIYGPLDVEAGLGRQRLAYRDRVGATVDVSSRVDRVKSYGLGVGYRLGTDLRLAFNVDNTTRVSDVDLRQYDGLRYGFGVTFGRQQ